MRAWRFPALVVIPALLVAGVVVQQRTRDQRSPVAVSSVSAVEASRLMPTARPAGAASSTWYCAGGTATGKPDGRAEHTVLIANFGDRTVVATVTVYPSEGPVVRRNFDVGAGTRIDVKLSELATAPWASALIEADGGLVAVEHENNGPTGRSLSACSSAPSATWSFPSGTTRSGAQLDLVLFNPFPDQAVLDVTFETEDGERIPAGYRSVVVLPGRVVTLEVSKAVTLRDRVATSVTARSGRAVADQVQSWDGSNDQPRGLSVTAGAPLLAETWLFPEGRAVADDVVQQYEVYNPGPSVADVELQLHPDAPETVGPIEPYRVSVQPRSVAVLPVGKDDRLPRDYGHWVAVGSRNNVPVAVGRQVVVGSGSTRLASLTLGSPVMARSWLLASGAGTDVGAATVTVINPSSTETARITIRYSREGRMVPVDQYDQVDLAPGARTQASVEKLYGPATMAIQVEASTPVVVEQGQVATRSLPTGKGGGTASQPCLTASMGEPVAGTSEVVPPTAVEGNQADLPPVPGTTPAVGDTLPLPGGLPEGSVPDDTAVEGTGPDGTGPTDVEGTTSVPPVGPG